MLESYPHIDPALSREFCSLHDLLSDMFAGDNRVVDILAGDHFRAYSSERPSICLFLGAHHQIMVTLQSCGTYEIQVIEDDDYYFIDWIRYTEVPKVLLGEMRSLGV